MYHFHYVDSSPLIVVTGILTSWSIFEAEQCNWKGKVVLFKLHLAPENWICFENANVCTFVMSSKMMHVLFSVIFKDKREIISQVCLIISVSDDRHIISKEIFWFWSIWGTFFTIIVLLKTSQIPHYIHLRNLRNWSIRFVLVECTGSVYPTSLIFKLSICDSREKMIP